MVGDSIHLSSPPSSSPLQSSSTPSPDLLARLAFSLGIVRVTKLGVYEEQFDDFAKGVAGIPQLLELGSESIVKKEHIISRMGTLHGFRQKLNLEDSNLLDEPEFLWEDGRLHEYYESVCEALEFDTRMETLNQRVDYAFQLQSTLMEILNTKTSHRLEWIIVRSPSFHSGMATRLTPPSFSS
ncbi:required for meiotic nuclear division protein 1, partial [Phenoliferia sp. Uapishka_3]